MYGRGCTTRGLLQKYRLCQAAFLTCLRISCLQHVARHPMSEFNCKCFGEMENVTTVQSAIWIDLLVPQFKKKSGKDNPGLVAGFDAAFFPRLAFQSGRSSFHENLDRNLAFAKQPSRLPSTSPTRNNLTTQKQKKKNPRRATQLPSLSKRNKRLSSTPRRHESVSSCQWFLQCQATKIG